MTRELLNIMEIISRKNVTINLFSGPDRSIYLIYVCCFHSKRLEPFLFAPVAILLLLELIDSSPSRVLSRKTPHMHGYL